MNLIKINYNYGKGHMTINLDTIFYPKRCYKLTPGEKADTVHYSTWCRIKKILQLLKEWEWCNEEVYKTTIQYLKSGLKEWYECCKFSAENAVNVIHGGSRYKCFMANYNDAESKFKLFNNSLNLLENTKYSIQDRVKSFKEEERERNE